MKKIIATILSVVLALSLVACSNTDRSNPTDTVTDPSISPAPTQDEPAKKPLIGVSMNCLDEMRTDWLECFETAAEEAGYDLIVTNADSKNEVQLSDIDSLIVRGCDLIVVTPTSHDACASGIEAIADAGIKSVVIDFTAGTDKYDFWYGGQTVTSGTVIGNYFNSILKEGETLNIGVIIGTWAITTTQERNDRLQAACPGLNIIAVAEGGFNAADAMAVMEDWIQAYPEMDAVYCHNDAMAAGAIQALNAAAIDTKEGGFIVTGTGGDAVAIPYLESGELAATAVRRYELEVADIMAAIEKLLAGEEIEKDMVGHELSLLTRDDF